MKYQPRPVVRAILVVGLVLSAIASTLSGPGPVALAANCSEFGSGVSYWVWLSDRTNDVRQRFQEACNRFASRIDRKNGDVHWWRGLLVQDYYGTSGNDNGAIFYDANVWQGAANSKAYVLWGPILTELWKDTNTWGPPISDVTEAWPSPPRDNGKGPRTTGSLVRFNNLDAYYNSHKNAVYVVSDVAKNMFDTLGGTGGFMGFPEANGAWAQASGVSQSEGFYQPFEGAILQTAHLGNRWVSYPVTGAIQAVFNSLEGPNGGTGSGSYLGFPLSTEYKLWNTANGDQGILQEFEGGGVVYDGGLVDNPYHPGGKTGGPNGVTYVIYNPIYQRLKNDGVLFQTTGMPIGSMDKPTDPYAYFQNGYATAAGGFKPYDSQIPHPPLPALLILPYDSAAKVAWTGGPHQYAKFPEVVSIDRDSGSGMDFSGNNNFPVRAMASGTVAAMEDLNSGFGSYVVIRTQMGGTAILYGHLKKGSTVIYRAPDGSYSPEDSAKCLSYTREDLASGPKNNCYKLEVGTFVHAGEVFAKEGHSGTDNNHLHVELMAGTRGANPYGNTYQYNRFGPSISWDNVRIGSQSGPQYVITPFRESGSRDFNYDGSAVDISASPSNHECALQFQDYLGKDALGAPILVTRTATVRVDASYTCTPGGWAVSNKTTVFAVGKLITSLAIGDVPLDELTDAALVSTDPNTVVTYDPNTFTLDSPTLGGSSQPTLYLPALSKAQAPTGTSPIFPTPTPLPSPTPTATPPTPGAVILSAPDFNNGGFEAGTMEGWAMPNGAIDVDGSFVHTGSYSVHGTGAGSAGSSVAFYRDYTLLSYQYWANAGRLQASTSGWFQNGDSEDYRLLVHFIGGSGTDLATFDSGWKHDSGSSYVQQVDNNRAVPAGTTVIRLEVQLRRNSGGYTDVDVDDLVLQLTFVEP